MESEGWFEKNFGRVAILVWSNLDLILSIALWVVIISFFPHETENLRYDTIAQISGGLLLVTVGIAAFFGHDKKVIKRLKDRRSWFYSAYIPSLFAALTILSIFLGIKKITVLLFIYAIFSTLAVSLAVISEVFKLE